MFSVTHLGLPWWFSSKESTCNARHAGDLDLILGLGRSSGGGPGNPLHYSCLGNPMDWEAWKSTVHTVSKSWTQLKGLSMHTTNSRWLRKILLIHIFFKKNIFFSLIRIITCIWNIIQPSRTTEEHIASNQMAFLSLRNVCLPLLGIDYSEQPVPI